MALKTGDCHKCAFYEIVNPSCPSKEPGGNLHPSSLNGRMVPGQDSFTTNFIR
jgi:hypothetical protein